MKAVRALTEWLHRIPCAQALCAPLCGLGALAALSTWAANWALHPLSNPQRCTSSISHTARLWLRSRGAKGVVFAPSAGRVARLASSTEEDPKELDKATQHSYQIDSGEGISGTGTKLSRPPVMDAKKRLVEGNAFLELGRIFKSMGLNKRASAKCEEGLIQIDPLTQHGKGSQEPVT